MKPLIAAAIFGILMMFSSLTVKEKRSFSVFAIVLLVILTGINIWEIYDTKILMESGTSGVYFFNNMVKVDAYNLWFNTLMTACTLIFVVMMHRSIEQVGTHVGEYYSLIFFILSGIYLVATFNNLLILFLGIELMSIPQYILAGSDKRNLKSSEASLKYFLMGAFSTGILLMGIALLYTALRSFNIEQFNFGILESNSIIAIAGVVLIIISFGFKVSAAPMHFWTPDVYDGAPTPFTAFMATIVKVAIFFGFLSIFKNAFYAVHPVWSMVLAIVTALTLMIGNFTAVYQQSVKRMLAYSSIAQAGFMLLGVISSNAMATKGIIVYALAYTIATLGVFGVLVKMKDYTYDGFNGLAKTQPFMAFVTAICLLSLAGIPLTAGFMAKYYMLASLMEQGNFLWLIILALLMAAISAYYYFKVIMAMYFKPGTPELTAPYTTLDKIVAILVVIIIIGIGIAPDTLFACVL
jgi:NADH-quinone oxidoreductase subunit N